MDVKFHFSYSEDDLPMLVQCMQNVTLSKTATPSGRMCKQGRHWFATWESILEQSEYAGILFTEKYKLKLWSSYQKHKQHAPLYKEAQAIMRREKAGMKVWVVDGGDITTSDMCVNLLQGAIKVGDYPAWVKFVQDVESGRLGAGTGIGELLQQQLKQLSIELDRANIRTQTLDKQIGDLFTQLGGREQQQIAEASAAVHPGWAKYHTLKTHHEVISGLIKNFDLLEMGMKSKIRESDDVPADIVESYLSFIHEIGAFLRVALNGLSELAGKAWDWFVKIGTPAGVSVIAAGVVAVVAVVAPAVYNVYRFHQDVSAAKITISTCDEEQLKQLAEQVKQASQHYDNADAMMEAAKGIAEIKEQLIHSFEICVCDDTNAPEHV